MQYELAICTSPLLLFLIFSTQDMSPGHSLLGGKYLPGACWFRRSQRVAGSKNPLDKLDEQRR
jgi:hypothetical protein